MCESASRADQSTTIGLLISQIAVLYNCLGWARTTVIQSERTFRMVEVLPNFEHLPRYNVTDQDSHLIVTVESPVSIKFPGADLPTI